MNKNKKFPKKWILIRGLTRSHFHWFDFKTELQQALNLESVETPELPGNGYLSELNTPDNLTDCVAELRTQIQITNEPVGLFGISLGGLIATKWAHDYPNDVSHLVVINSSFSSSPFYHRLKSKNYFKILLTVFSKKPTDIEKFILQATSNTENHRAILQASIDFQKKHPIRFKNLVQQLLLANQGDFKTKPNAETLILTSKNDRLVHHKCSLKIAAAWDLQAKIHPTAGHDLPLDDSAWIIEKIKSEFNT